MFLLFGQMKNLFVILHRKNFKKIAFRTCFQNLNQSTWCIRIQRRPYCRILNQTQNFRKKNFISLIRNYSAILSIYFVCPKNQCLIHRKMVFFKSLYFSSFVCSRYQRLVKQKRNISQTQIIKQRTSQKSLSFFLMNRSHFNTRNDIIKILFHFLNLSLFRHIQNKSFWNFKIALQLLSLIQKLNSFQFFIILTSRNKKRSRRCPHSCQKFKKVFLIKLTKEFEQQQLY